MNLLVQIKFVDADRMVHIEKWTWVIYVFEEELSTVLPTVVHFLRKDFGDQNLVLKEIGYPGGIAFTSDSIIVALRTLLNVETQINQAFVARILDRGANEVLERWLVLRLLVIIGLSRINIAHFLEIIFLAGLRANFVAIGVDEPYS